MSPKSWYDKAMQKWAAKRHKLEQEFKMSISHINSETEELKPSEKALLAIAAGCQTSGADNTLALALPPRPKVGGPGLTISDENHSPSAVVLPANLEVEGLELGISGDSGSASMSDSEDEIDEFQVDRRIGFELGSCKVPVSLSLTKLQSSLWPGVATGNPRTVGRPQDWRQTNESQTGPAIEEYSDVATQYLLNLASAASEQLADRCPTCSANLALRDQTYGIKLITCPFCQMERPRQVDVPLENMPETWTPPVRIMESTLPSTEESTRRRSQSPPPSEPVHSYRQRSYSPRTDSDLDATTDPYQPQHHWKKYSRKEKWRQEWENMAEKFRKRKRMKLGELRNRRNLEAGESQSEFLHSTGA